MNGPEHVYVHVPFCRRRCVYCDFSIAVRSSVPEDAFADAVLAELRTRSTDYGGPPDRLETVYFGGGTPSLLEPKSLERVVTGILGWAERTRVHDVTLEANPEDVTPERARAWRECGVTRVSLGVQSFRDSVLQWMRRPHDAAAVPRAVDALRSAGITALSLDLIIGIPKAARPHLAADIEAALDLEPDHLSVYTLTVEPQTPLGKWTARGLIDPAPDERYADEFLRVHDALAAAGFEHYEVSNYAQPGCRSRHNAAYWSGRAYLGLGPSAHSYIDGVRSWNVGPWAAYERAIVAGGVPESGRERLSDRQRRLERVYLGLRTAEGVEIDEVVWQSDAAQLAIRSGWARVVDGAFRLTPEGWLRLDTLVGALTTDTEGG